ncbi:hypothetical protein TNCV_5054581 [Trichonephila clavipes]|nr:hypothetical protein TNCV_5054581 [Trichonephila clavipes]
MLILEESTQLQLDRLNFLELTLTRLRNGKCKKPQADFYRVTKDIENQRNCIQQLKGELISLGSCPISDCQYHINLNANQIVKRNEEEALKLQYILAKCFASPTKVAKKQKILQNYSVGVDAPINVQNKFTALAGSSAMPDSGNAAVPVAPKIPFIHLRYQRNYNLIMQEVTRRYPKSKSKLSGEYLKILASTVDEHREITAFFKEKGEQFFAIDPIEVRPQNVVIKGLPTSTDVDDIRKDLTERGFMTLKSPSSRRRKQNLNYPSSWWRSRSSRTPLTSSRWKLVVIYQNQLL